jgi:hypothetical protein
MSDYREQSSGPADTGRTGISADFSLQFPGEKIDCTIYQAVQLAYSVDGQVSHPPYAYTEAWEARYSSRRKSPIDQNGTDSLLVYNGDVAQGKGLLTVLAVAWVERGGVDPDYAVGAGDELWGNLFGVTGLRPAPAGAQKLTRYVRGVWAMGGPIHFATEEPGDEQLLATEEGFKPPLVATKGTYPISLPRRTAVECEVAAGGKRGAMVPVLGGCCGLERANICFAFSETRLTAIKRATETVALFLSLIDCQDWETGVMQLCLRSESYSDQMKAECKLVEALQHGPTPYGVHPMTGMEAQRDEDL